MKNTILSKFKTAPLTLLCTLVMLGCSHAGYEQTKDGVLYKIHTTGNTKKIKLGDIIKMNFSYATDKDSIISSSWKTGRPARFAVQKSRSMADMMDIFILLAEKDSATVKLPSDSLFDSKKGMMRPPYFKPHSYVVFTIKIEKVMTQQEAQQDVADDQKKLANQEGILFSKYVADNHLKTDSTKSGVRFVVKTVGTGPVPKSGDSVFVNYTGKLLNGKVFDSNDSTVAKANNMYNPSMKAEGRYKPFAFVLNAHQIIQGWDDYFAVAKKGTKATLYVPSKLAYGERESGPIPAYSTLIFDVELVNVKAAKAAPKNTALPATPKKKAVTSKKK